MMRSLRMYFGSLDRQNLDRRLKSDAILPSQIVGFTSDRLLFRLAPIPLDADAVKTVVRWQVDETLSGKQLTPEIEMRKKLLDNACESNCDSQ